MRHVLLVSILLFLPYLSSAVGCGDTISEDTLLTFDIGSSSEPCPGDGLIIAADGITLDCRGHAIHGGGSGGGVIIDSRSGVTIKNCFVTGFMNGFDATNCSGLTLINNTAYGNQEGFRLIGNTGSTMFGNEAYLPAPSAEQAVDGSLEDMRYSAGPLSTTTLMAVLAILLVVTVFYLTRK
jgi:parallel beta-helix repeat protein